MYLVIISYKIIEYRIEHIKYRIVWIGYYFTYSMLHLWIYFLVFLKVTGKNNSKLR